MKTKKITLSYNFSFSFEVRGQALKFAKIQSNNNDNGSMKTKLCEGYLYHAQFYIKLISGLAN